MNFPEMTVELREGRSHGLRAPSQYGTPEYKEQLVDALELAQGAKRSAGEPNNPWPTRVLDLLQKHCPFEMSDIPSTMREFGFASWAQVVDFVHDDECIEMAVYVAKWAKAQGIEPKDPSKGFIDGGGLGWYNRWYAVTKPVLEKAFDEKYYHKATRPQVDLVNMIGVGAECVRNYLHPGHHRYPAGHSAKFAATYIHGRSELILDSLQDQKLKTCAMVLAHGRSGGFVHFPEDQLGSWYLARVSGFEFMGNGPI